MGRWRWVAMARCGHLRWRAAGKNGGSGACNDREGVFRLPTDDPKDDPADGDRECSTPWIHDSNEWVHPALPPRPDIWADWNLGKRPVLGDGVVDEPAWWEKYGLPMLPSAGGPRGGGGLPAVPLKEIADYEGNGVWRLRMKGNDWRSQ